MRLRLLAALRGDFLDCPLSPCARLIGAPHETRSTWPRDNGLRIADRTRRNGRTVSRIRILRRGARSVIDISRSRH